MKKMLKRIACKLYKVIDFNYDQRKYLADVAKTSAVSGVVLPLIAKEVFEDISINLNAFYFLIPSAILLIIYGTYLQK